MSGIMRTPIANILKKVEKGSARNIPKHSKKVIPYDRLILLHHSLLSSEPISVHHLVHTYSRNSFAVINELFYLNCHLNMPLMLTNFPMVLTYLRSCQLNHFQLFLSWIFHCNRLHAMNTKSRQPMEEQ